LNIGFIIPGIGFGRFVQEIVLFLRLRTLDVQDRLMHTSHPHFAIFTPSPLINVGFILVYFIKWMVFRCAAVSSLNPKPPKYLCDANGCKFRGRDATGARCWRADYIYKDATENVLAAIKAYQLIPS